MATITANNGAAGNFQDGTSWVGGVAPTAADDAVLPVGCTSMTIGTGSVCRSLTTTAFTGTLTHTAGVDFRIGDGTAGAGNVALAFGTFTYTLGNAATSLITFISTSATVQTVNFNGKTTGNVTFNATSGGSWKYTGGHVTGATATVTLTKGTLDINGQTCSWGKFDSNNGNTRTLTLGAAGITITGTGNAATSPVYIENVANFTITANTSIWTISGNSVTVKWPNINWNGASFVITGGSFTTSFTTVTITMLNFTWTGTAAKTNNLILADHLTCTGTFTINGNSTINRVLVSSSTVGTAKTITAATVSVTNTDFQDITGAGAGSWDFSASTTIGDCGGNSGITFPASVAQYYGGVNLNGSYLRKNNIGSNYCSSPDSAALSIVSDIELQARVSFDDWSPATTSCIIGKIDSASTRSYYFECVAGGQLQFLMSVDGTTAQSAVSSATTSFTDGTPHWVKATYVKSTGVVQFFTADDSTSVPSSWTQLGTDISTITPNSAIFDSTSQLEIGGRNLATSNNSSGKFYRARVLNGVGGTVVFDADFTAQSAGTKSFTESSSQAATVSLTVTGGNWSASSWTTRVPLPQDDAYLGNAYAASQTVTADMPRLGRSIDWTGATGSPTWSMATSVACSQYGSLTLISGMSVSGTAGTAWYFAGRGNYIITSAGKTLPNGPQIQCPTGTYTLQDAFNCDTKGFNLNNGTFDANNFNVTCLAFILTGTATRGVIMGTGLWTLNRSASPLWDATTTTGLTFSGASSQIYVASTFGAVRDFRTGGLIYGTLTYSLAGSTGELDIVNPAASTTTSFAVINFSDATNARSLKFTAGTTTTIRNGNGFNVRGTAGKLMTIDTITGASTFTLTSPNQQSTDYITPTRSTVDASPKWYAGANSTDGTGNTNWLFSAVPASGAGASGSGGLRSKRNLQNVQRLG